MRLDEWCEFDPANEYEYMISLATAHSPTDNAVLKIRHKGRQQESLRYQIPEDYLMDDALISMRLVDCLYEYTRG